MVIKAEAGKKKKIVLKGFCAFNRGDAQIDDMSFEKNIKALIKNWKGQAYGKCTVIIEELKE